MGIPARAPKLNLLMLIMTAWLAVVPAHAQLTDYTKMRSERVGSTDYPRLFDLSRELMIRQALREFIEEKLPTFLELSIEDQKALDAPERLRGITEGQLITLMQRRPKIMDSFEQFLRETNSKTNPAEQREALVRLVGADLTTISQDVEMKRAMYPLKPVDLWIPSGPSYTEVLFVGHIRELDGKMVDGQDLEGKMVEFIDGTERELMLNVFDFDSEKIADALIRAKDRGVNIEMGIDEKNINKYERVRRIYQKMLDAGVKVQAINSVGLNHQKLFTRDWNNPERAAAIDSSGNCTVSCVGRYGEGGEKLAGHQYAIPNANHLRVIQGQVAAHLIRHEVSKTLVMRLHGTGETGFYPSGTFLMTGPNGAYKIAAFSPSGAADNINKYMVRSALLTTRGPIRIAQFVITSNEVGEALFQRAQKEIRETGRFEIKGIVDSLQSVADASEILPLLGITREKRLGKDGKKIRYFPEDPNGRWAKLLGKKGLERLRSQIRVPPSVYGKHKVQDVSMTSLMHHKIIMSPESNLVMDGSFNISANALKNQEQFSLTFDPKMSALFEGLFEGLYSQTTPTETVYARILKANELAKDATQIPVKPADRISPKKTAPQSTRGGPQCISVFGRAG